MPIITLRDGQSFEVEAGTRLVLAIKNESSIDILHRCGGYAKCTTCRVDFDEGEPETMTRAEHDKLVEQENLGEFRLSCQIACEDDMTVEPLMTTQSSGLDDPGPMPEDDITPEPEWMETPA
jgi:ferredoxin